MCANHPVRHPKSAGCPWSCHRLMARWSPGMIGPRRSRPRDPGSSLSTGPSTAGGYVAGRHITRVLRIPLTFAVDLAGADGSVLAVEIPFCCCVTTVVSRMHLAAIENRTAGSPTTSTWATGEICESRRRCHRRVSGGGRRPPFCVEHLEVLAEFNEFFAARRDRSSSVRVGHKF